MRSISTAAGCSTVVVGAQAVGASARGGCGFGVIGGGDGVVRRGGSVAGGGRIGVLVVVKLVGDLADDSHDYGVVFVVVRIVV